MRFTRSLRNIGVAFPAILAALLLLHSPTTFAWLSLRYTILIMSKKSQANFGGGQEGGSSRSARYRIVLLTFSSRAIDDPLPPAPRIASSQVGESVCRYQ